GGTLLTIGSASRIGYELKLPLANAVADSAGKALPRSKFYVPGSILSIAVDTTSPIGWGMQSRADVFFDDNPAFRLLSDADTRGIKRVAWFDGPAPLRSGWALGQQALNGAAAILVAPIGKGNVVLYGPEIDFRSQAHGAFRFLFNGIYYGQESKR
ncbi:MAG: peptidase, partial [Gemmatimonadales bacterium]